MNLKKNSQNLIVLALFCFSYTTQGQSTYGQRSLRSALIELPHFKTDLGRKTHRYEEHFNNEYRLYDFYARQAAYHLNSSEKTPNLLLPFPGMDGGRRGHWGTGNEQDAVAYQRKVSPEFTTLTDRRDAQYHLLKTEGNCSVLAYDIKKQGLKKFLPYGELSPNMHPFEKIVDRFGLNINVKGEATLIGAKQEWEASNGKKKYFKGYFLHNKKVIYKSHIFGTNVLENHDVLNVNDEIILTRSLEFLDEIKSLKFNLPLPADKKLQGKPKVKTFKKKNTLLIKMEWPSATLFHYIVLTSPLKKKTSLQYIDGTANASLSFKEIPKNAALVIHSWIGTSNKTDRLIKVLKTKAKLPEALHKLTTGGKTEFTKTFSLQGKINSDPNASGTAYEIDDIPVPIKNTYNAPMTISGIGFTSKGIAYVCTLVGDVWRVSGIDNTLKNVTWKRYAAGLNLPLGLEVVNDIPYVSTNNQFVKLQDLNNDHEADYYESFTTMTLPGRGQARKEIQRDQKGNFYYSMSSGIYKVTPDGSQVKKIGRGARNPLGLGVRKDGLVITDSSEGNNENGTCTLYEAEHPSNTNSEAKGKRILYLPRGFDNSPGSRRFLDENRFGPLGKGILGVSFGQGRYYSILRDANNGTPQAAVMSFPGDFSCGTSRLKTNPLDGQVYTVGMDGWGDYSVEEGAFHRIRYTQKPIVIPTEWQAYSNGLLIKFNKTIDKTSLASKNFFAQQWNYIDSKHTYGSPEYSVKKPENLGHDYLKLSKIHLLNEGKAIFFEMPEILPAMCTQLYGNLKAIDGSSLTLNLFATINKLRKDHAIGSKTPSKAMVLAVPEKNQNGSTYETITTFFDKKAGRELETRAVGQEVPSYKAEDLNYKWIYKNVLEKQCIACHGKTTQHDFSTYESLMEKVKDKDPYKTHLYGMINSKSMPPYPLPTVSESAKKAVFDWIKNGAKK